MNFLQRNNWRCRTAAVGQKRRNDGTFGMSGTPPIASELCALHDGSKGQFLPPRWRPMFSRSVAHRPRGRCRVHLPRLRVLAKAEFATRAAKKVAGSWPPGQMQSVAISNRRLVAADDGSVSFRWKDYRIEGPGRWKTMAIAPHEFIRGS